MCEQEESREISQILNNVVYHDDCHHHTCHQSSRHCTHYNTRNVVVLVDNIVVCRL